jgi:ATP-dependent DNA helicase RecQ
VGATASRGASEDAQIDPDTQAIFDRLRHARGELAREHDLPAYIVCHDRTLVQIAREQPATLEALEEVKGMGPHKVRMYGQKLLDALHA